MRKLKLQRELIRLNETKDEAMEIVQANDKEKFIENVNE